jgi:hypothetical protein
LSPLDPRGEAAKDVASTRIGEIGILKRDAAASMDELPRAGPIDHFMVFANLKQIELGLRLVASRSC